MRKYRKLKGRLDVYESFSNVTRKALHNAVREAGESVSQEQEDALMKTYDSLDVFPDVEPAFKSLEAAPSDKVSTLIFSNGTGPMVQASISGSPTLSPKSTFFSTLVLVDDMPPTTRKYKPAPVVYEYLVSELGTQKDKVWLVTSNPFDVDGAMRYGIRVCWVDRMGGGWIDGLGREPDEICGGVDEVVGRILGKEGIQ
jgi:2-haloacid dehalogenase